MEKEYYTIREVSKICGISIRTLYHYDAVDLLKPGKGLSIRKSLIRD